MRLTKSQALEMLESDDLVGIGMAAQPDAPQEERSARGHLPDRPQHQLHQFLHRILFVLRVLPPAGRQGRLRPLVRDHFREDRRDARTRRHRHPAAGRPQHRSAHRVLRKSAALHQDALSAGASALFFRAGNSLHRRSCRAERARHDRAPDGRRAATRFPAAARKFWTTKFARASRA